MTTSRLARTRLGSAAPYAPPPPPPGDTDSAGYPLDDNGTVAGMFGAEWLETDAPHYHAATHTYAVGEDSTYVALPAAGNLASQRISINSGERIGAVLAIPTAQAPASFDDAVLGLVFVDESLSPLGSSGVNLFRDTEGAWSVYDSVGNPIDVSGMPVAGAHVVGVLVDSESGEVWQVLPNGTVLWVDHIPEGGDVGFLFMLSVQENPSGDRHPGEGETIRVQFIPNAADIPFPFPAGVTDWDGHALPSAGGPAMPLALGFASATINSDGDKLTIVFNQPLTEDSAAGSGAKQNITLWLVDATEGPDPGGSVPMQYEISSMGLSTWLDTSTVEIALTITQPQGWVLALDFEAGVNGGIYPVAAEHGMPMRSVSQFPITNNSAQ